MENHLRSFAFLGGQHAPRASDGVGIRILYRCGACQRVWLQDGKRIALDLQETQIQALAHDLAADLEHLPAATCRLCLYRAGGGAIEIDEYGNGAGFGFSWECPRPTLVHALLTIHSHDWLEQIADSAAQLPDIVTQPEKMRAVLAWFVELLPPRRVHLLDPAMLVLLDLTNPPGFGQPGTEDWQWKGCRFATHCPPLGGRAQLVLVMARPAREPFSFSTLFPVWQSLTLLTLLGTVAGEKRSDDQTSSPS